MSGFGMIRLPASTNYEQRVVNADHARHTAVLCRRPQNVLPPQNQLQYVLVLEDVIFPTCC